MTCLRKPKLTKGCSDNGRRRNFKIKVYLGDLDVNGKVILKYILDKRSVKVWSGVNWVRIGFSGRSLGTR
jgi:hypothetical protein